MPTATAAWDPLLRRNRLSARTAGGSDLSGSHAGAGVGAGRGEFLKPGDVVKLWIEKIGSLTNTMV
jgi:hypothetical protein